MSSNPPLIPANAGIQATKRNRRGLRRTLVSSEARCDLGPGIRRDERGKGLATGTSDTLKRATDIAVSGAALIVLAIPLLLLAGLVRTTSPGPAIHWSKRVGRNNGLFLMPKFRTMRIDTPQVATHLMAEPERWLTPIGGFLRKTSLDELPQLISVLKGDMSLVGPRPALFNQDDLVALRTQAGVEVLRPGLTGWAQVNGRDELPIPDKVQLDADYLRRRTFWLDVKILAMTLAGVPGSKGVSH